MSPLLIIILLPLLTAAFVLLFGQARKISILGAAANLILSLVLLATYKQDVGGYQFDFSFPVLPEYGLNFVLGADGFSLAMLLLATLVTFAAILVTKPIGRNENLYYACLFLISAGAIGAFASVDLFFFYAFHELALIPTFLLIGIWGSGDKQAAAWKITIYLALGSFVLLIGLIGLYLTAPVGQRTFYLPGLLELAAEGKFRPSDTTYLLLLIGFGTLVSLFPFHTWAPQAYASAPTPAAMLHAGVLKKFGLYGLIRIAVPLCTENVAAWANLLLWLLVANILYLGLVTIAQKRLDLTLGYSSVMHMGYIFLGFAAITQISLTGAAVLMFAHGLSIAALFALCGEIRERTGTLEYQDLGGLAKVAPSMGLLFGFAAMASVGLPGFANFVGEVMIFFGAFQSGVPSASGFNAFQIATVAAVWGVVISAVYMLRAYRNVFMGEMPDRWKSVTDIHRVAKYAVVLLIFALLIVGFYPRILTQFLSPALIWP